jgi:hypothetical protein
LTMGGGRVTIADVKEYLFSLQLGRYISVSTLE